MAWITVVMGVSGLLMFLAAILVSQPSEMAGWPRVLVDSALLLFVLGAVASPWVGNFLATRRPRR